MGARMSFVIDPRSRYLLYARAALPSESRAVRELETRGQGRLIHLPEHVAAAPTLTNLQLMAELGAPVPPPMGFFSYAWPRGPSISEPYKAQIITANMMVLHKLCYVLNEMRTGKTMSSLWAADFAMTLAAAQQGRRIRTLIVSSLSTLLEVWVSAVKSNFLGRRSCVVLPAGKRVERLDADVDFYITNHDALREGAVFDDHGRMTLTPGELAAELIRREDIQIVIVDEASVFKDAATYRSRVAARIIRRKEYRWPMTGSPTPQCPTNIHGLRKLCEPDYTEPLENVRNLLLRPTAGWRREPLPGSYELAAQLLRPAVRFRAADCFDIPPQLPPSLRHAELTAQQQRILAELKKEAATLLAQNPNGFNSIASAANAGVLRSKTLQVLSGIIYDDARLAHKVDAKPRLKVLDEILSETDDKIIILAPFTATLHVLIKHLGDAKSVYVDGATPMKERSAGWREFETNPRKRLLIAQPEVLKFGLDLTAASVIVWFSPVDKTETWIQANKRVCGPRQTKPTAVICIKSHSVEAEVYRRLQTNENMQDVLLKLLEK
jgi:hypothetical protein